MNPPEPPSRTALVRRARRINRELAELYPDAHCELNFAAPLESSAARDRRSQRLRGLVNRAGSEPFRFSIDAQQAGALVASTGWEVTNVLDGRDLGRQFLQGTGLPAQRINPAASAVSAVRATIA